MLRDAQALAGGLPGLRALRAGWCAAALTACLALGGCAGGFSLSKAEIDPTALTGSTGSAAASGVTAEQASDENTIRNAVSAADVEGLKGAPLPWSNTQTGSRGAISALVEEKDSGTICRSFTTSRERFDGVSLYKGRACMVTPGAWQIQGFDPQ